MVLNVTMFMGTASFAGGMGVAETNLMRDGLFIGLGANYNSINLTQNSVVR